MVWRRLRSGPARPQARKGLRIVLKREIWETKIRDRFDVAGVIDDRARVVAMWRSLGLTCLAVAEGNF